MKQNSRLWAALRPYVWITLAALLYAIGFDWFYAPNLIGFGGVTGVGQVLNALFPILPVGGVALVLNIPLFLLGWRLLGGHLLVSSLFAMTLSSLLVDALNLLITFQPLDQMLAAVCGGALVGLSLGVIFTQGATTGGTDLAARLLKLRLPWLSLGKLLLALDLVVIALAALVFGSVQTALYGVIAQVVSSFVTDTVLYGLDNAKVAYIISDRYQVINDAIIRDMDRGVTLLHGEGGWSGTDKKILLVAFKQRQIVSLKRTVKELDPDAFLIVCDAHEVLGKGFRRYQHNDI